MGNYQYLLSGGELPGSATDESLQTGAMNLLRELNPKLLDSAQSILDNPSRETIIAALGHAYLQGWSDLVEIQKSEQPLPPKRSHHKKNQ